MTRLPSIKTLLQVTPKAQEVRELLEKKRKTRSYPSVQKLERACFNPPGYGYRLMTALNEILEGYGIEALTKAGEVYPSYEYINMGETYAPTLMRDCGNGRVFVSSWGDIVERGNYN